MNTKLMTGEDMLAFIEWCAGFYDTNETGIGAEEYDLRDDLELVGHWFDAIVHRARVALGREADEPEGDDMP
jgi:hypothetical protein